MEQRKTKRYPGDGPPRHIQALLMDPRKNRTELLAWVEANPKMRAETRLAIEQACK